MSWVIRITASPRSCCRRRISSRICACVVTSSAVVGSSAIRMRGSAASASAIITRWRSPPDSSNEYASIRCAGRGMPTIASNSIARARAARLDSGACSRIASISWLPMVWNADSELIGSWNTRPISPPRIARICAPSDGSLARSTTVPSARRSRISPPTMRPGRSTMRRIERAVTLLPQPEFADDAQRLAREQIERGAVHRAHGALVGEEIRLQVAHGQDRLSHTGPPRRAGRRPGS